MPEVPIDGVHTKRGASIHGDYIFMGTLDAKLLAFDRKTGEVAWEIEVAPYQDGIAITSAPLARQETRQR